MYQQYSRRKILSLQLTSDHADGEINLVTECSSVMAVVDVYWQMPLADRSWADCVVL